MYMHLVATNFVAKSIIIMLVASMARFAFFFVLTTPIVGMFPPIRLLISHLRHSKQHTTLYSACPFLSRNLF